MKETFVFNPYQMQRAVQLETVAQRIFRARNTIPAPGVADPWLNYMDTDGKLQFYKVTPQVMWGMMACRKSLIHDLGTPETAHAIIEKYLQDGENPVR